MPRNRRYAIGIPILALLLGLGVFAMRWGLASLDLWRASEIIGQLVAGNAPLDTRQALLARGMEHLDRAYRLNGGHPDLHDKRGQIYYLQAIHFADAGLERGALLSQAVEEYRKALAMRPSWPYFWLNLVVAKAEWGIFDREFRHAVRRTAETGPWEPRVQLQLIRVDFIEQQRLDRRSRERIDEMLQRALQMQPGAVLQLAVELGQLPRVCSALEEDSLLRRCERLGWVAPADSG